MLLIANHFLWVEPIWGFHHDYPLGIFGWLFLSFEEGDGIFPNPIGLLMTFFPYLALHRELAPWAMGKASAAAEDSNSETVNENLSTTDFTDVH